jgi:hypothetical protein
MAVLEGEKKELNKIMKHQESEKQQLLLTQEKYFKAKNNIEHINKELEVESDKNINLQEEVDFLKNDNQCIKESNGKLIAEYKEEIRQFKIKIDADTSMFTQKQIQIEQQNELKTQEFQNREEN